MDKTIVISENYLNSYEKLDDLQKKIIRKTIKRLSDNAEEDSLRMHKLDNIKCDDSFRGIRCDRNLRIILAELDEKLVLLYVGIHEDVYKWVEGKYLDVTDPKKIFVYNTNTILH